MSLLMSLLLVFGCSGDASRTALVWRSELSESRVNATDPPPTFRASGTELAVDLIVLLDGEQPLCVDSVQYAPDPPPSVERCLLLQFRLGYASGDGGPITVRASSITSTRGDTYAPLTAETLVVYPGATDTIGSALFPNSGKGSTISIELVGELDEELIEFKVPSEGFESAAWSTGTVADDRL